LDMLTIGDCIEHASSRFGQRILTRCHNEETTYEQLANRCAQLAEVLRSCGLHPGDRVAILAANCHRYFEVFLAVPAAGFVVVPLNTRLATPELLTIVADCQPRILITDRNADELGELVFQFERVIQWPSDYEALLSSVRNPAQSGSAAPLRAASTSPASQASPTTTKSTSATRPTRPTTQPDRSEDEAPQTITSDRLAALFYTGGTTGRPKGVMLTHENLVANSFHKTIAVGLRSDEVFLAAPAMFHVAGIAPLLSLLTLGARIVFVPGFEVNSCLDIIGREGITMVFPVPTMLAAMVTEQRRSPRTLTSLRMLGHAGSSIAVPAIRAAAETFPGVELAQFYGATETASIVTCMHHEEAPENAAVIGSCGQPVIGVSVRVVDGNDVDVARNTPGEVIVQGRNIMAGYWDRPEETAEALLSGWYRTGDIGFLNETQHLFVIDRAKDMIVTGAENVYCTEVENVLYAQAGVIEVAVFGIPHETWGEAVHAVVVVVDTSGNQSPDAADGQTEQAHFAAVSVRLETACRAELAGFKVPKSFDIRSTPLPKSGPGKVLKRALRDPYWADQPIRVR
jgi:long-chain acyl-CoA synthetase